mgnify:CR=1 FL=1
MTILNRTLIVSMLLSFGPAVAHPGHEHHEIPAPVPQVVTPPPPPPPAPLIETPKLPVIQVNLPTIAPNMLVPTDIAGLAGSLGHAKGIKQQLGLDGTKASASSKTVALIERDPRYQFSGDWLLLNQTAASSQTAPTAKTSDGKHTARAEQWVALAKQKAPAFMPTSGAEYCQKDNQLILSSGAVLVRPGREAIFLTTFVDGQKLSVKIASGALALISIIDGKPVVLNLTDRCCSSVVVTLPECLYQTQKVSLSAGEMLELHHRGDKPFTSYLCSKIISQEKLAADIDMQLSRCHYLSAMRRYNIDHALEKPELNRVLKTAAALAHINLVPRN